MPYVNVRETSRSYNNVLENSDRMRHLIHEFVSKRESTTVKQLEQVFNLVGYQIREYLKYLIAHGNVVMKGESQKKSYYIATDEPYKRTWPKEKKEDLDNKKQEVVKVPVGMPEVHAVPSHVRVIRLLDRKPSEISDDERMERRRQGRSTMSMRGSSLSMFDGW